MTLTRVEVVARGNAVRLPTAPLPGRFDPAADASKAGTVKRVAQSGVRRSRDAGRNPGRDRENTTGQCELARRVGAVEGADRGRSQQLSGHGAPAHDRSAARRCPAHGVEEDVPARQRGLRASGVCQADRRGTLVPHPCDLRRARRTGSDRRHSRRRDRAPRRQGSRQGDVAAHACPARGGTPTHRGRTA